MARGNLIQGYGRGKLGSTVYSISHGVQVSRVYNPAKFDRKSDAQIIRRAQWIAASQYYSRAIASQFKFAFENKRPNESFQNAFMKRNWNKGVPRAYGDVNNPNYPSVGNFIVSEGSLRPLEMVELDEASYGLYFDSVPSTNLGYETLGYFSRSMVNLGYRNGDIITITLIETDAQAGSPLQPIVPGTKPPIYHIYQFRLDINSTINMESMGFAIGSESGGGYVLQVGIDPTGYYILGCTIQVSRQLKNRLLVSHSEMTLNVWGKNALIYGQSLEWRQVVIDSWQSSGNALLQGDDSENATSDSVIEVTSNLTFPRTWDTMQGKAVVTNKILTNVQFSERIAFLGENDTIYRGIPQSDGTICYLPKTGNIWTAIARQDSTEPHRWVFESSASGSTITQMVVNNL